MNGSACPRPTSSRSGHKRCLGEPTLNIRKRQQSWQFVSLTRWACLGVKQTFPTSPLFAKMTYTIFCALIGDKHVSQVKVNSDQSVLDLKEDIKTKKAQALCSYDPDTLTLYQVYIDISTDEAFEQAMQQTPQSTTCAEVVQALLPNTADPMQKELVNPSSELSQYFGNSDFSKQAIHILAKLPPGESIYPRCGAVADMILVP
jgi:hypothetical protein